LTRKTANIMFRYFTEAPKLIAGAVRTARMPNRLRPGQRKRWREMTAWRYITAPFSVLPDFLIVGAQRSGTTTLYRNLIQHPLILPCIRKEVHYFDRYYNCDENWYRGHFPTFHQMQRLELKYGQKPITGEATPNYMIDPSTINRIAKTIPDARLIVLLRNPVDRAFSNYHMNIRKGNEHRSFEEVLESDPVLSAESVENIMSDPSSWYGKRKKNLLQRGLYVYQLEDLYMRFPKENILVLQAEQIFKNESKIFSEIINFLDLPDFKPKEFIRSKSHEYDPMNPVTRNRLADFFGQYNEQLSKMLGRRFDWD